VNSISPGGIATSLFGKSGGVPPPDADRAVERLQELFATLQPIPRSGMPEDVANAALYLASDASGFITGHDIVVDGGVSMGQDWETYTTLRAEIGRRVKPPV
jgi:NAD(P)-dependent dehydrogenase (short-subunit alcohol dehydrogenase family)